MPNALYGVAEKKKLTVMEIWIPEEYMWSNEYRPSEK